MKPIFKWMGSKRKMMPLYLPLLDVRAEEVKHFHDLFAGSLASSMWAYEAFPNAQIHINEYNPFLVGLYECVRDDTEMFLKEFRRLVDEFLALPLEKELIKSGSRHLRQRYKWYYQKRTELRDRYHNSGTSTEFYALQYMLQRISFGGAWQTTKENAPCYATPPGDLNVTQKALYDVSAIIECAEFLQDARVTLSCGGYEQVRVEKGADVIVFADPPYYNTDQKYDAPLKEGQQRELVGWLNTCSCQDNKVMMTNSPWDDWKFMFLPEFKEWSKDHTYTVGQDAKQTQEVLWCNFFR